MNRLETGRVMGHLLRHRRLDTTSKRKTRGDERELALVLAHAGIDERADLEGVLQGMGYDLAHFDDFKTQGIAPGGQVFLLIRRLDQASELFSERWIDERMQVRNDTVTTRRIWFTQFWFVLLDLLYTQRGRVPTEVSRYVETTFTRADLADAMRGYINDKVRKLGKEAIVDDAVYACLIAESGSQVDKYADRFLELMADGALLDGLGDERYRQSLLGAVEMKNNYLQGLEPWLHSAGAGAGPLEAGRGLLVSGSDSGDASES